VFECVWCVLVLVHVLAGALGVVVVVVLVFGVVHDQRLLCCVLCSWAAPYLCIVVLCGACDAQCFDVFKRPRCSLLQSTAALF
jgi:hypothetical protein